jgi:hypothetical protein
LGILDAQMTGDLILRLSISFGTIALLTYSDYRRYQRWRGHLMFNFFVVIVLNFIIFLLEKMSHDR